MPLIFQEQGYKVIQEGKDCYIESPDGKRVICKSASDGREQIKKSLRDSGEYGKRVAVGNASGGSDPAQAGFDARYNGKPKGANPYTGKPRANYEKDSWNEGWDSADKEIKRFGNTSGQKRYDSREEAQKEAASTGGEDKKAGARYIIQNTGSYRNSQPKVGDKVHLGFGSNGGAGYTGILEKIEGDTAYVKNDEGRTFKGPVKFLSQNTGSFQNGINKATAEIQNKLQGFTSEKEEVENAPIRTMTKEQVKAKLREGAEVASGDINTARNGSHIELRLSSGKTITVKMENATAEVRIEWLKTASKEGKEGNEAFSKGKSIHANPYPKDSKQGKDWSEGWFI